jgi:hypothetical protein
MGGLTGSLLVDFFKDVVGDVGDSGIGLRNGRG